jgi:hypothetical protein
MSLEVIGNEILPNLYVKNIMISRNKLSITVAAFDYVDEENKVTWMTSDFVSKQNIYINLILTSDGSTIDPILNSTSNYNLYSERTALPALPDLETNNQVALYKELGDFKNNIISKLENASSESYVEINHTFDVTISDFRDYQDIRCYAFFSYDPWWSNVDGSYIDVSGQNKKMLNGPISSEYIISNGSIVETTNRFTIDEVGYAGPVHFHNGQYMEGSLHKDTPHRTVDREVVTNTKISVVDYHMFFNAKPPVSSSTNRFFDMTKIAVANKKIYGFFRFKTDEYFATKSDYRFFVNSFATLNVLKIRDNIRMVLNGQTVDIKEILINHEETNDLYFYFEKDFNEYIETTLDIEYQLINENNFFKKTLQSVANVMDFYRSSITVLLNSSNSGDYIDISRPQDILNFIKGYSTLFSMSMDLTQSDLVDLKRVVTSSLYKNKLSRDILKKYYDKYSQFLNNLKQRINSLDNQSTSLHTETRTRLIELQNYRNSLCYLGGRKMVDPDIIATHLESTNGKLTEMSGLFQNLEQVFLPRYIRTNSGGLRQIRYNDLEFNDAYLKILQPNDVETQDEEDIPLAAETPAGPPTEQTVDDPDVEPPLPAQELF